MKNLKIALILAGVACASATTASAQVLGSHFVGAGASYEEMDTADGVFNGWNYGVEYNLPVIQQETYGLDVSAALRTGDVERDDYELEATSVLVSSTAYFISGNVMRPYVTLTAGYIWQDIDEPAAPPVQNTAFTGIGSSAFMEAGNGDTFVAGGGVGVEAVINPSVSFRTGVDWLWIEESGNTSWSFGTEVNYWFTEKMGAAAGIAYMEGEEDIDGLAFTLGFRYRL